MNTENQDDQVFSQLFKKAIKDSPRPELDRKILDYAAEKNNQVRSSNHFNGGWKVPLSLAACLLLVFTVLIQFDQNSEQLELPPLPTADKANVQSEPAADEITAKDMPSIIADETGVNPDIGYEEKQSLDRTETKASSAKTQGKLESRKKHVPESPSRQGLLLEKYSQETLLKNKESTTQSRSTGTNGDAAGTMAPESSIIIKSNQKKQVQKSVMQSPEDTPITEEDLDFAPLPVEDWLLMIELLVAKKDYAEAARQLNKFKQAHPNVNVEDLDSKIP